MNRQLSQLLRMNPCYARLLGYVVLLFCWVINWMKGLFTLNSPNVIAFSASLASISPWAQYLMLHSNWEEIPGFSQRPLQMRPANPQKSSWRRHGFYNDLFEYSYISQKFTWQGRRRRLMRLGWMSTQPENVWQQMCWSAQEADKTSAQNYCTPN